MRLSLASSNFRKLSFLVTKLILNDKLGNYLQKCVWEFQNFDLFVCYWCFLNFWAQKGESYLKEQSVLDYVIVNAAAAPYVENMVIDESKVKSLTRYTKGKAVPSDHHLITCMFNIGARPGVTALQRSSPFFVALQSSTSFSFSAPALQYIPLLHAPTIFCLALQRSKQFKIKAPALQPIFLSFPALQLVFLSSSTLALQPFFSLRSSAPVTFSVALQRSRTPWTGPIKK